MSNHYYTISNSIGHFTPAATDHLVIEVAANHFACMVVKENKQAIEAFELFNFGKENEIGLEEILQEVFSKSAIVKASYAGVHIHINDQYCVPVPIRNFDEELSVDYLNAIVGEDYNSEVYTEFLTVMPGIVNVFRISKTSRQLLEQKFHRASYHHSNTNMIKRMMSSASETNNDVMAIQFYNTFFKVCVMKGGEFVLVQSFEYGTSADVLYHLLNIQKRLELNASVVLDVSGLIDIDFKIFEEIVKYFKNIVFDDFVSLAIPADNTNSPAYYFSPFLNLAI